MEKHFSNFYKLWILNPFNKYLKRHPIDISKIRFMTSTNKEKSEGLWCDLCGKKHAGRCEKASTPTNKEEKKCEHCGNLLDEELHRCGAFEPKLKKKLDDLFAPHKHTWDSGELDIAIRYANELLDEPYADPDDHARTVARQFIRLSEKVDTLISDAERKSETKLGELKRTWYQKGYADAERKVLEELSESPIEFPYGFDNARTKEIFERGIKDLVKDYAKRKGLSLQDREE
jgi:hypothetical protein